MNTVHSPAHAILYQGHLRYPVASSSSLVMVANGQLIQPAAARAFLEMGAAASKQGIHLLPKSAHRTFDFQAKLFQYFAQKMNRNFEENLKHVAPAGYSEHHTGYAIDIAEIYHEKRPFELSSAYAWLQIHAASFGFEMSYPVNNVFGVNFEPWHWRWVGDALSQQLFFTARSLANMYAHHPIIGTVICTPNEKIASLALSPALLNHLKMLLKAHQKTIQSFES